MLRRTVKTGCLLAVSAANALLSGCATSTSTSTPPLYGWGGYQTQVYEYLKGQQSPEEQINALEKSLQEIRAKGTRPPPGFHAHLGTLYASVGKDQQAAQELLAEKQSFPESSIYMDFLLKNVKQ